MTPLILYVFIAKRPLLVGFAVVDDDEGNTFIVVVVIVTLGDDAIIVSVSFIPVMGHKSDGGAGGLLLC